MIADERNAMPRLPKSGSGKPGPTLERIRESLQGLHHGEVTVVVQDGVVVQIERTEKHRLPRRQQE